MAINIYPPLVNSTQPAFVYTQESLPIYFTLPDINNIGEIKHVQVRIVYQSNNKSIVNTTLYPDGVVYKPIAQVSKSDYANNVYYVNILKSTDLSRSDAWHADYYYKIQVRFGTNDLWGATQQFTSWKNTQVTNRAFSEWSTVMIIKAISEPTVRIANQDKNNVGDLGVEGVDKAELTTTPLFYGVYENSTCNEIAMYYRFQLFSGENELIEDSDWQLHDTSNDEYMSNFSSSIDVYRFDTVLEKEQEYKVLYMIRTENGYEAESEYYEFRVTESYLNRLENIRLSVVDGVQDIIARENACMYIYLDSDEPLSGNYVITRSSEKSDYTIWEDLKYLVFSNRQFDDELVFTDYTVESGVRYKYAFQQENSEGLRSMPLYENTSLDVAPSRVTDFEYSYLLGSEGQLKLMYDAKMSNFKHTVMESKQDTLGSKYPVVLRNGESYYAEFPITGLISLNMDIDNNSLTFFEKRDDGYYYKGQKIISNDKYTKSVLTTTSDSPNQPISTSLNTYDTNLTQDNRFIERVFREKVEEFLNNGDYKLFKSATEGNIFVVLTNVSLTPNETLGRMIYSFSATAYEILDNTIENLDKYNIINIGSFNNVIDVETTLLIGQINGLYKGVTAREGDVIFNESTTDNLINDIVNQCEYVIGGGYQYQFKSLKSIWVEQYPKISYTYELNELYANLATAKNEHGDNSKEVEEIQQQIDELEALIAEIENEEEYPLITFVLNGQEISLGRNKIYNLDDLNLTAADTLYLKHTGAVIVNYIAEVTTIEVKSQTVSSVYTTSVWGQIEGAFTNTKRILNNYNYYRKPNIQRLNVIYDGNGSWYDVDGKTYTMGVIQTLNLTDVIKYETKMQVEEEFDTLFDTYVNETGQYTDGERYYLFESITKLEIEADEGTRMIIGKEGEDKTIVVTMGPTEKYVLDPIDKMVSYIAFEEPTYAIINYRARATIQIMAGGM